MLQLCLYKTNSIPLDPRNYFPGHFETEACCQSALSMSLNIWKVSPCWWPVHYSEEIQTQQLPFLSPPTAQNNYYPEYL